MDNASLARLLRAISAAYDIKEENIFKVVAYDRAAAAIERATSDIKDIWDEGELDTIPGVGKSIASHLDRLFKTGTVPHFIKVMQGLPPAMFEFLDIPGIGPKTAYKLCLGLGIKDAQNAIVKLREAAKKSKISRIEGFGRQSEKDIIEGIDRIDKKKKRMILPYAWELAQKVIDYLVEGKVGEKTDPLGSLRRMTATVGDIDLAIATKKPARVIKRFLEFPGTVQKIVAGKNTARIIHRSGHQIDLKTMKPAAYGALLQHFTGSKQHNIHLREIAQKKGLSLSEYGIKRVKKVYQFADEKDFYNALGMDWIPPELREDTGEIEASLGHSIPNLVEIKDLKGDLHLHSNFPIEESHDPGQNSMEEMIRVAEELGYEYLGFAEHNPSQSHHSAENVLSLLKRKKEKIDKLNCSRTNKLLKRIFNGLEIDIKPDGNLAIPEKALSLLDYAIVSIHTEFEMPEKDMTRRVLRALDHPKIKIFGHPTGRKLNYREGYELDWETIFNFCKKKKIWLEINAWPDRLDLPDSLVCIAVKNGVKMIISSDAHAANQLDLVKWGISVARRGWAQKSDIINTLTYDRIMQELKGGEI